MLEAIIRSYMEGEAANFETGGGGFEYGTCRAACRDLLVDNTLACEDNWTVTAKAAV
jgi:hypothetical protein